MSKTFPVDSFPTLTADARGAIPHLKESHHDLKFPGISLGADVLIRQIRYNQYPLSEVRDTGPHELRKLKGTSKLIF
jgi:hypothetical protein